jgi:hypothetical protein
MLESCHLSKQVAVFFAIFLLLKFVRIKQKNMSLDVIRFIKN